MRARIDILGPYDVLFPAISSICTSLSAAAGIVRRAHTDFKLHRGSILRLTMATVAAT